MRKNKPGAVIVMCFMLISVTFPLLSKEIPLLIIDPEKISRYKEDRIVFQRIEKKKNINKDDFIENYTVTKDNSVENLLIIKDSTIHFISDGFDSILDIQNIKTIKDSLNEYTLDNDFWKNKINGKPDYIRILNRRNNLLINSNEEFVTAKFGSFYKSVRDRFIKLHAERFHQLLKNRSESGLTVNKNLISSNESYANNINQKFFFSVKAKASDGTIYYCEDADGDGITETFTATRDDGFDWGINSGPNILCIIGNNDKEIESFIGKLVNDSVIGTTEEEKRALQQFPSEKEVIDLMYKTTPADKTYE